MIFLSSLGFLFYDFFLVFGYSCNICCKEINSLNILGVFLKKLIK